MGRKTTSEIICQNFRIPPEIIFQDYKCTFKSSVTFFGRLYVGEEHFLFIANMFGLVKKCTISISSISKIEYQQSSNTLSVSEIIQGHNQPIQYVFGSFKNNNAYKLMMALWKGQKVQSDILIKEVDEQTEKYIEAEKIDSSLLLDEGHVQANFFSAKAVETEKQKIVQIQLPCSVQQFYEFFLADKATVYPRKKYLQSRNGRDIVITDWRKSEELNSQVRQITATLKVTGVPFVKEAGMSQVWMLKRQKQAQFEQLHLNVVTQMADVPYCTYFNVQQSITISRQSEKKCKMVVNASIVFNKSTYMKNTILTRTFSDLTDQYEAWAKNVKLILEQLRKKQDNSSSSQGEKSKFINIQYEKSQPMQNSGLSSITSLISNKGSDNTFKIKGELPSKIFANSTMQQKINQIYIMVFVIMCFTIAQFFYVILF